MSMKLGKKQNIGFPVEVDNYGPGSMMGLRLSTNLLIKQTLVEPPILLILVNLILRIEIILNRQTGRIGRFIRSTAYFGFNKGCFMHINHSIVY